ncbi:hypothetical protein C4K27_0808 [Pseudomonas chlororaphis subsp. chlororaphis]|nr:hypothetical protein C4K27_0808 [Pseudomonas chlororaphis subsp. chlororaphis]
MVHGLSVRGCVARRLGHAGCHVAAAGPEPSLNRPQKIPALPSALLAKTGWRPTPS